MSDPLALAAVSVALRNLLQKSADLGGAGTTVSVGPPDKARNGVTSNQLNLFLYLTTIDESLRNCDPLGSGPEPAPSLPPLPLVLHYMITAYGADDDDLLAHRLLGRAMIALHDHPVLSAAELRVDPPGSNLWQQVERVRIQPEVQSLEEMSRLWTAMQTQYRISVTYRARVVLIDSRLAQRSAAPVLRRGPDDRGAVATTDLVPNRPILIAAVPPGPEPTAVPGEPVALLGHRLAATVVTAVLRHQLLGTSIEVVVPAAGVASTQVTVPLPSAPAALPAGVWNVALRLESPGVDPQTSNEVQVAVRPSITTALPLVVPLPAAGPLRFTLACAPPVQAGQGVELVVGDRIIALPSPVATTATLRFAIDVAQPVSYRLQLFVDDVGSRLVDRSLTPPAFRPDQSLTVTP